MAGGFLLSEVFGDLRFFKRAKGDLNLLTMVFHVVLVDLRVDMSVSVLGVPGTTVVLTSVVLELELKLKRQMLFLRHGCWSCCGRAVMLSDGTIGGASSRMKGKASSVARCAAVE